MPKTARVGDAISHGGSIVAGSPDTLVNGIPVARLGDAVVCDIHGPGVIVTASPDILVNGLGLARLGDLISCGAVIVEGSENVFADEGGLGAGVSSIIGTENQILATSYSSALRTLSATQAATGNVSLSLIGPYTPATYTPHAVLVGAGSDPIGTVGPLADGQLLIGQSGGLPVAAALTQGSGITITPGAGTITIAATGTSLPTLTDGELLIGSTGNDPVAASLTQGDGITITPGPGSITISATAVSGPLNSIELVGATSGTLTLTVPDVVTDYTISLPAAQVHPI
jgi:uncharacterized Zn-binding protein involved in type VI secretion